MTIYVCQEERGFHEKLLTNLDIVYLKSVSEEVKKNANWNISV